VKAQRGFEQRVGERAGIHQLVWITWVRRGQLLFELRQLVCRFRTRLAYASELFQQIGKALNTVIKFARIKPTDQ
jgi:hypothetical protein